jgi:hypothetical protein
MSIVQAPDDMQFAFQSACQPAFAIDHGGIFAKRHAMNNRDLVNAHERPECCIEHRAVDIEPVGIGTVKEYEGNAVLGTCFHHITHGGEIGIEPGTNILDVIDDIVDPAEVCRERLLLA